MLALLRSWLFPSLCAGCEAPGPALCEACAPRPAHVQRFWVDCIPAFALGAYDGALRRAIVAMKRGERDPLDTFCALLRHAPVVGALVPLPTTRRRAAERGFDQSVTLGRRLAEVRGLVCVELLEKRGRPQEGRSRRDRLAAVDRFRLRPSNSIPSTVTLLDDVCTTGATLHDAALTLRRAGITVGQIVVLARAEPNAAGMRSLAVR